MLRRQKVKPRSSSTLRRQRINRPRGAQPIHRPSNSPAVSPDAHCRPARRTPCPISPRGHGSEHRFCVGPPAASLRPYVWAQLGHHAARGRWAASHRAPSVAGGHLQCRFTVIIGSAVGVADDLTSTSLREDAGMLVKCRLDRYLLRGRQAPTADAAARSNIREYSL
jgi:hypothetical protein